MYNGAEKRINSPLRIVGVSMVIASVVQVGMKFLTQFHLKDFYVKFSMLSSCLSDGNQQ